MSKDLLKSNLNKYKRKYYLNIILRRSLLLCLTFGLIWLIFSTLEGIFWFSSSLKSIVFYSSIIGLSGYFAYYILIPVFRLLNISSGISDEFAAKEIGKFFPDVDDKLLNYLQLSQNYSDSSLLAAAISQKSDQLRVFDFPKAINLKLNLKWAYYVIGIIVTITLFSFISPDFFGSSTNRILNYDKEFSKPAPFKYVLLSDLVAFKNDGYELKVKLDGNSLPALVTLIDNDRRFPMRFENGVASFSLPNVSRDKEFQLEAAGFYSDTYELKVYSRPEIRSMIINLDYPNYTGLKDEQFINSGNLIIPEGSTVKWNINCSDADEIIFKSGNDSLIVDPTADDSFYFSKRISQDANYELALKNAYAANKSPIRYSISVIKDEFPQIDVEYIPDTITFRSVFISGNISDDYGFRNLNLNYTRSGNQKVTIIPISFNREVNSQQFYFRWNLDSLDLAPEEYLEMFVSVGDNDGVNGSKVSVSDKYYFRMPNEREVEDMIAEKSNQSEEQLDKTQDKAEQINDRLEELENRLKNQKELDWQDEKLIEELMKEKEKLNEEIKKLQEQHQELIDSQKEFGKQDQKLQKKAQELQKLMNEVLDEETKQLYDELQKLLKENADSEQVMDQLSKIQQKEQNLERELERAIELFKRMKLETQLSEAAKKLEDLSEKQKNLSEQELDKNADSKEIGEKQEEIKEQFEEIKKELEEANELNEELKSPEPLENLDESQEEISENLEELSEELNQENNDPNSEESNKQSKKDRQRKSQQMKNTGEKMKKMSDQIMSMQESAEMMMMEENMEDLREILDNLVKLSMEQESVMEEIKAIDQIDPRFIELSQDQLQLISNAEVIEDSLLALADRVAQISTFVTREVSEMNRHLEETMYELRERNKGKASSHQQFAMTSMNNLALLLSDVLKQMQMQMNEAMGNPKPGQQKDKSMPSMSQIQKQLSEQIKQLKGSGKSGRELSEELAKLAAEQSELRRQLEEMEEGLNGQPKPGDKEGEDGSKGNPGSKLREAIEKMEENEVDLVNKRITQELINRQEDILTRLLEAEESMREQKQSPEREGETASDIYRKLPPAIEEYLKAKKQEIELLKTIPLDLSPFYKNEVNEYFKRLSESQE